MKKAVSLMLAVLMLSAFVACSSENTATNQSQENKPSEVATAAPEENAAPETEANEYIGKTFVGQGMSVSDTTGSSFNIVDVELTVVDGEKCDILYPVMTFTPTYTVTYTLEGNVITLGDCLACAPSEAFSAAWAGVARKTFILNEDGTMVADPTPEQTAPVEEAAEEVPAEEPAVEENAEGEATEPEAETEAEAEAEATAQIPENAIYFDYAFSLYGQDIADSFYAEASVWYAVLGTEKYEATDSEEELFAFTGSWCLITCYKNGTYVLTSSVNEHIKDTGTWSWENYQFTLTRDADAETPIVAAIKR